MHAEKDFPVTRAGVNTDAMVVEIVVGRHAVMFVMQVQGSTAVLHWPMVHVMVLRILF